MQFQTIGKGKYRYKGIFIKKNHLTGYFYAKVGRIGFNVRSASAAMRMIDAQLKLMK